MGKLVAGINGPFVGKVGNTIGSSWRGIPYIKSLGIRRKPATEREKINRYIFGMTQQWLYPLTPFLRVGFNNYTPTNQGVNAAKSFLYKNALIKDGFNSTIDPTLVKVSHGSLPLPDRIDVELTEKNKLIFTWDRQCEQAHRLDQVMLLAYDIEGSDVSLTTHGEFRKSGRAELNVDHLTNFVVYAAFLSADRLSQSDSVYLGSFSTNEITQEVEAKGINKKGRKRNKVVDDAEVGIKSTDSALSGADQESEYNAEIEEVPKNQLSLFDSFEAVMEIQSEADPEINLADMQEPKEDIERETTGIKNESPGTKQEIKPEVNQQIKPEPEHDLKPEIPSTKQETASTKQETADNKQESLGKKPPKDKDSKKPVIQRFTYINPNANVEKEVPKTPTTGDEEPNKQIIIKEDRITYITSKKHLDNIKKQDRFNER